MVKIMYVSREEDRQKMAVSLSGEMGIQVVPRQVIQETPEELQKTILAAEEANVDVIMAQGRHFTILRELNCPVPLIPCYFHGEETVEILFYLRKWLRQLPDYEPEKRYKVALVTHQPLIINREMLEELFHMDLRSRQISVREPEALDAFFRTLREEGAEVVVGAETYRPYVEKYGMFLYYRAGVHSREMMRKSFSIAKTTAESVVALKQNRKELLATIDYAFEAVLTLDSQGRVVLVNSKACQLFQLERQDVIGRKICDVIPQISREDIHTILHEGGNLFGSVLRTENLVMVVNLTSLHQGKEITGAVAHFTELKQLEQMEATVKNQYYAKGHKAKYHFSDILGESQAMLEAKDLAQRFANYESHVLLLGETGTGKELFAQSIHNAGLRQREPFVALNCGAIPVSLLESELFGYVDGAFTGASRKGKKGMLEIADRGTIFLDEISEMDWQGQAHLLRVLEEHTITRIGDDKVIRVDVRVIAASNKNLRQLVEEGKFREDLYYRLNVLTLHIPPLREREQDVLLIARNFLIQFGEKYKKAVELTPEAEQVIAGYSWPGNVRQLRNFCERLAVIAPTNILDAEFIIRQMEGVYMIRREEFAPRCLAAGDAKAAGGLAAGRSLAAGNPEAGGSPAASFAVGVGKESWGNGSGASQAEAERNRVIQALNETGGNRQEAARRLGISKSSLWRRMKRYGISEKF